MKQKSILALVLGIGLALALGLVAGLALARDQASTDSETIPTVVSYQGEVLVDGQPYNGTGYFKFAVVNTPGAYTYWSNDGTSTGGSEPTSAEALSVEDGLFAVLLGNSAVPFNMPPVDSLRVRRQGSSPARLVRCGRRRFLHRPGTDRRRRGALRAQRRDAGRAGRQLL